MKEFAYRACLFGISAWRFLLGIVASLLARPLQKYVKEKFAEGGIVVNGEKSWDMQVHCDSFYLRVAQYGSLGIGESYMDGLWDCDELDEWIFRVYNKGLYRDMQFCWDKAIHFLQFDLFNLQTITRAPEVALKHYDLGNLLFETFLDPTMNYSCGYWRAATSLEEAQRHKMELIGRKLQLTPGMRVLDIGCGWGGLCKYLAETFQVQMVGITLSVEGAKVAQERCADLDVEIRIVDYRTLNEQFDRIVSVGMFEHVGRKNYQEFFEVTHRCLRENGLFLLHTIGMDSDCVPYAEEWSHKYIFPNGMLPDPTHIPKHTHNLLTIEDWHNFGADYDKTLMAWHQNLTKNWSKIEHLFEDSKKIFRMWTFFLRVSAGAFRTRKFQLWQVVLSKNGVPGGYNSVR